ncbi:hypothetical protein D9756_002304 [Leucocoprinus leucothites]|uniref:DUF676 domain-containing protein n=1 Tax=Leucocoprinus leucothites TaxID=201217 RepID=A0A8H5GCV7_9AGAR|nr:hypothetical protein D9756_002304 [Leucoagaricus leucothites]
MPHQIHLLVLIHGMWGNPGHLAALERTIKEKYAEPNKDGEELEVLLPKSNENVATYDGIDWGGERVADEVCDRVEELAKEEKVVVKLSITGYSLGGLVARYMLGILEHRKFFAKVEPVNFITIATPHIGLLRYPSMISSLINAIGPKLLSKTGEQFYCQDKWSNAGRPLIEVMADPSEIFFKTLSRFKNLRLYANAVNDVTVPYCTSAIETEDVFAEHVSNGLKTEMEEDYEHPTPLSREWFENMKPLPLLPPAAQFRFPFNLIVYGMLPILAVPALSYALYRLSCDSKESQGRIKQFESEESYRKRLSVIFQELEHEMESAAVDIVDNPDGEPYPIIKAKFHPVVTPTQKKMAKWLNQLPFQKKLAFFPWVRNSHAMIICRDSHRFHQHKRGEGVVRHWADNFEF